MLDPFFTSRPPKCQKTEDDAKCQQLLSSLSPEERASLCIILKNKMERGIRIPKAMWLFCRQYSFRNRRLTQWGIRGYAQRHHGKQIFYRGMNTCTR